VPEHFRLIPGMAVTAEIKAGERSVISYFLYPLLRGLDESIREP
jgi:hemolysin D